MEGLYSGTPLERSKAPNIGLIGRSCAGSPRNTAPPKRLSCDPRSAMQPVQIQLALLPLRPRRRGNCVWGFRMGRETAGRRFPSGLTFGGPAATKPPRIRRGASCSQYGLSLVRRGGRAAEGGGLLNRYRALKPYRGFESPSLRQFFQPLMAASLRHKTRFPGAIRIESPGGWLSQ